MHQCLRYKELGLIVFSFKLYEAQIKAIHILYYEQENLLLFAKMSFGKNLIFQLILFFIANLGVILTIIPLKLFQVEQSEKINRFLERKVIILNRENNINNIFAKIANKRYSHIFTSLEIALSKKLKQNILDFFFFTKHLYLFAVNEIYLVEE